LSFQRKPEKHRLWVGKLLLQTQEHPQLVLHDGWYRSFLPSWGKRASMGKKPPSASAGGAENFFLVSVEWMKAQGVL
jgi:hypothetical protein